MKKKQAISTLDMIRLVAGGVIAGVAIFGIAQTYAGIPSDLQVVGGFIGGTVVAALKALHVL